MELRNLRLMFLFVILVLTSCKEIVPPPLPEVVSMDMNPTVHPSGNYIVYLHATQDIADSSGLYILDLDTGVKTLLLSGDVMDPDFSPDGMWLVFNVGDQIFKVRLKNDMSGIDSSTLGQLTYEGRNYFPAWSPSGDLIAFDSNREGSGYKVWIRDSASGNFLRKICGGRNPDWAPSGDRIVYQGPPAGTGAEYEIWIIDTTSTDSQRISSFSEGYSPRNPAWSPDGEWIGYTWSYEMEGGIKLYSVHGDSTVSLIDMPAMDPAWFPDSRTLVFSALNPDRTKFVLWKINIDGTGLEQVTF